jgi:hypothetical protein
VERRVEPRLKTETAATLTVIRRNTAREFRCVIVNVSSGGYGLLTAEPLEPGETIQLHLNGARVLAVVRHCGLSGDDRYSTGVERVDEWMRESNTTGERFQEAHSGADDGKRTLGRPKVNSLNRLSAVAIRHLFSEMEPKTTPRNSRKTHKITLAAGAALALVLLAAFFGRLPLGLLASLRTPGSTGYAKVTKRNQPSQPSARKAPQEQFSPEPQPDDQVRAAETQAPPAVPSAVPAERPRPIATNFSPAPQQHIDGPQGFQHQILITAHDRSWLLACADGKKVFEKLITAGNTEQISFSTQALLRSGNAGALDIAFDARSLGRMGDRGTIHAWRFSPEGNADVPPALNRTCEIQ